MNGMKTENDRIRISNINKMIIELASGNFNYKIERSDKEDDLETLSVLLNMMAEEIRVNLRNQLFTKNPNRNQNFIQFLILLDANLIISRYSPSASKLLQLENQELKGKLFSKFLGENSAEIWREISAELIENETYEKAVNLEFKNKRGLNIPASCTISIINNSFNKEKLIAIISYQNSIQIENDLLKISSIEKDRTMQQNKGNPKLLHRDSDIKKIKIIYQYILENLEEPLLSLKELAHAFGTNEFKLKNGFKQLYNTSVFRFQTDERLNKAKLLIENTDMQLKTIALRTGFKSFPHFSKVFKKKFGYNPSSLKKLHAHKY